jgi:hypothetical protein
MKKLARPSGAPKNVLSIDVTYFSGFDGAHFDGGGQMGSNTDS